jgi:cell division protein FtsI (penicillin-binding protein 3)
MTAARRYAGRRRLLLAALLLGTGGLIARGVQLQVVHGARWEARASDQQRQRLLLPAPRGTIYDRNGVPLAASQEAYRIAVAPRELQDARAAGTRLREALGLTAAEATRAVDRRRSWVVLTGRYGARERERLQGMRGVYFERVMERFYPHGGLALAVVGRVNREGEALGGIELELDSLLRGKSGVAVVRRDARGEPIPGALATVLEPVPGRDVYLTLDHDLQEIAEDALLQAVAETGAAGGDLLLVAPRTGEVLAAASRRSDGTRNWRGVTEPYEPGSTLKPFFVAGLLSDGRVRLADSVYAEEGRYTAAGRTVSDVKRLGWITVEEALRYSSNIAMVKLTERTPPGPQYRTLRDFGFGTPTGVDYPSESSGLLRRPERWSRYSQGSLAIGYEVSVTPLQMVLAYAALGNGGVLMEPRVVREVRSRDGRTAARFEPREVRRVVSPAAAREVAATLADAVETGSGRAAALGTYPVAGKTGTARRVVGGRYLQGAYTASFAGFFPAVQPQVAFLVKLDDPQGGYYGGATAAPVTRALLEAALAASDTPLDRGALVRGPGAPAGGMREAPVVPPGPPVPTPAPAGRPPVTVRLAAAPPAPLTAVALPVPDVQRLSVREAAGRLVGAGFQVRVEGSGMVTETVPAAGVVAEAGSAVVIRAGGGR